MGEYQATPVEEVKMKNELKRTMRFLIALSTVMGTVIGAGVFLKAASMAEATGSASLHMSSWFLGGIISVCVGLAGAELAATIPETGRMIRYTEQIYGDTAAFLLDWAQIVIYFPADVVALSIIFGTQFVNLFGLSRSIIAPVVVTTAIPILLINFLGSKAGGAFQSITLVYKLIPLFVIVILGLFRQEGVDFQLSPIQTGENFSFFSALEAGLLVTMSAYDGWIHVGNISRELKRPTKNPPKVISLGIIGIIIVYLLISTVLLGTTSIDGVAGNSNAAGDATKMIFDGFGRRLVTVGILISVYGAISGYTLIRMRLPYVMAEGNNLPFSKLSAKLHDKTKVPVTTGILELVIAIGMMTVGGFDALTDMLIFAIRIFYTMVFVGVIFLCKKELSLFRPHKVPMYPSIPLVAIIGGTLIVSNMLIIQIFLTSVGVALTLVDTPIYLYSKRRQLKRPNSIRTALLCQTKRFV